MNHGIILDKIVTTLEIVEALRAFNDAEGRPTSDYYVAKILQVSPSTIINYKRGGVMAEDVAIKAAKVLDWDEELLCHMVFLERIKKETDDTMTEIIENGIKKRIA